MDGDQSAKTMDAGANASIHNTDLSSGIHESGNNARAAGEKSQGTGTPLLHKDGAIGSAFKADGAIGSLGQKVGGPFDKQGAIGKNFNADGKVGGTIQDAVKGKET